MPEIQTLDPLKDARWDDLISRHPRATVFHQRGWLQALARTYGYEPIVLTSARPGEPLTDGIVLCRVSSWMTGARLVSLPFADHCEPLLDDHSDFQLFTDWLRKECNGRGRRYFELRLRPRLRGVDYGLQPSSSYWFHELDLKPDLNCIFHRLHKNSFRRKIRRAEREQLTYESGRSEQLLGEFYRLLLLTRRRHHLPAQPRSWFGNLLECMDSNAKIMLARKDGVGIAALLILRHGKSVTYKYGCSDARVHNLGAMPFLLWNLIEESKALGIEKIDFGRTDMDNAGLIVFKDRLGTTRELLKYYRYANTKAVRAAVWESQRFRGLLAILPDSVLSTAGRLLYKHLG